MRIVETPPERCGAGHRLGPHRVLVGFSGCLCTPGVGHRTYRCLEPGCGHITYVPPCTDPREQTGKTRGR